MKKYLLLSLLIPSLAFSKHSKITITFKNGEVIEHVADSYWTNYHQHDNYYEWYQYDAEGTKDSAYVCLFDWVMMNPVSRETKKGDYKYLRDKANELGHTAHYYDKQGTTVDQYGVSFRYDEVNSIEINNAYN